MADQILPQSAASAVPSGLATKLDIAELRAELKADITDLKAELKADITDLKAELKGDISGLKVELKTEIARLQTDTGWIKWIITGGVGLYVLRSLIEWLR
jgi:hypothetical protein